MPTQLLNVDCMEYMARCEDKVFDLAIVDPPYGIDINNQSQGAGGGVANKIEYVKKNWDKVPPSELFFDELRRVSKNQIIWGANHFISKMPLDSPCWIVWDKDNGSTDFADCELAHGSFTTAVRKIKLTWAGMRQQNMQQKEQRIHPTQKPVQLYKWLLNNYAEKGQRIIDTHLGSGSSAIAAHYFGCDFVGLEIDKEYFDDAQARFKKATAQLALF